MDKSYKDLVEDSEILKMSPSLLASLKKVEDRSRSNYLSLFPSQETINRSLPNAFIYLVPMEGVGGDGYWLYEYKQSIYLVLFDCMGHGYKASMMVRMYIRTLNKIIIEEAIHEPSQVLTALHNVIEGKFRNNESSLGTGVDISILKINPLDYEMFYSGAKMDLFEVNENGINIIKASKRQVGEMFDYSREYKTERIDLKGRKTSKFYLFSDGITDMMGGPENKRYGSKKVKELLLSAYSLPIKRQKAFIAGELNKWQGSNPAMDDALLMGFTL